MFPAGVKIDPVNQRVVVGENGVAKVITIPRTVKDILTLSDVVWERMRFANGLAVQGVIIDVPIDVWGWDPVKTILLRRMYGYTWVPSAMMDSVKVAPGLFVPGCQSYDPDEIPVGAILVPPPGALEGE